MKKLSLKKTTAFLVFILFLIPTTSFALPMNEFPASEWTAKRGYAAKTLSKLGFGIINVVGGWTGIVSEFYEPPRDNIAALGLRAIARVVTNTVGGALHVVTFPVPVDIPLPGGGTSFSEKY